MAYSFGDSFDLYSSGSSTLDPTNGYWDTGNGNASCSVAGRFPGSRALYFSSGSSVNALLVKSSGANDPVHHVVCAYYDATALSGSGVGTWFTLSDGATAQCTIWFRQDGAILLCSGAQGGTVLATYTGAVPAISTWYPFEFEVVIGTGTSGSFAVRKSGNTVNDFTATGLNTAPSGNAYASKLSVGAGTSLNNYIDDLFWRSGSAAGTWLGDLRCYVRMPASDAQAQFSRTATSGTIVQTYPPSMYINYGFTVNYAYFTPITPAYSGTVTSVSIPIVAGNSGHLKCAIFADNGSGGPGAVIQAADAPASPVLAGTNVFTFTPNVAITKGVQYWIGAIPDTAGSAQWNNGSSAYQGVGGSLNYATFPTSNPILSVVNYPPMVSWTYTTTAGNWQAVSEAPQDGLTSYVYDANAGDADFYNIASLGATPASVLATTTRAYAQKSDAGTRTAAVQLKSGATVVASPASTLSPTNFSWLWRTDIVDPNTGAAWTAAAVSAAQIGPTVIA